MRGIEQKWRPSMWGVLGGALGVTLALSLAGMIILRYWGPEIGFKWAAVLLAAGIGALTMVIWVLLLRLLLRPVTELADYAAEVRIAHNGEAAPPEHFGTRELFAMGQSVMEMASTLSKREQTVRSFTDHVIHEVKTPVTTVQAATELLEDSEELSAADRVLVQKIRGAGKQMQAQLAALREMVVAREADYHGETQLVSMFDALVTDHPDVTFQIEGGAVIVPLSRSGLTLVLGHLVRNAVSHGAKDVAVDVARKEDGTTVKVTDNGPGISDGNRGRIFDPFFTTRRETGGTGMGLYIVSSLLQAHGARIEHVPSAAGTTFLMTFEG